MAIFNAADILIPKNIKDNWAVIACDQYTSQPEYWNKVKENVGSDVSTYNLVLPEIYLDENQEKLIEKINQNMNDYLNNGVFDEYKDSMIYINRTQSDGRVMSGIIGTINLDDYEYTAGANSLCRATEATVIERIPPRVKIRRNAPLELPHVLVLIDDPQGTVIEPLEKQKNDFKNIYNLSLMLDGGQVSGYVLDKKTIKNIQSSLETLLQKREDNLLFAVGDGNHSLATAKECAALNTNPIAKQALVEIVNIHSKAIEFEPIYRVLFNCNPEEIINGFVDSLGGIYQGKDAQKFTCVFGNKKQEISVKPTSKLPVGTLQSYLDKILKEDSKIKIDYIHSVDATIQLAQKQNTLGIIFEGMKKEQLFDAVSADGSLPRKTFSMGKAEDKRYYVEARKIK